MEKNESYKFDFVEVLYSISHRKSTSQITIIVGRNRYSFFIVEENFFFRRRELISTHEDDPVPHNFKLVTA